MAERTSTRGASRRTTPRPVAAPARGNRITRSQSREIGDSEAVTAGLKRRNKAKAAESANSSPNQRTRSKRQSRKADSNNTSRDLPDLSTVLEDPNVIYSELHEDGNNEGASTSEVEEIHPRLSGGVSAFSGTTARNSHSAQDDSELNPDDLMDVLEELCRCSDQLLKFLLPPEDSSELSVKDIMNKIQAKGSKANKTFSRLHNMFLAQRDGSDSYIDYRELLEMLIDGGDDLGPWRPDALLQKANLAVLTSDVLSRPGTEWDGRSLEELDRIFPKLFVTRFVVSQNLHAGDSVLKEEIIHLALDIRTQYALRLLRESATQSSFNGDMILQQVFFMDNRALHGWDIIGLQSEDLTVEIKEAIGSRLEDIRASFASSEANFANEIVRLEERFSWLTTVQRATSWINQRLEELDRQIIASGGFKRIDHNLKNKLRKKRLGMQSVKAEDESNGVSPQLVLDYEQPSETSNVAFERSVNTTSTKINQLKLGQFNANSPKALAAVTEMKRIEDARRLAVTAGKTMSDLHSQRPRSEVQGSSTAAPAKRAVSPDDQIGGSSVPSSAPAKLIDQQNDDRRPQETDDRDSPPRIDEISGRKLGSRVFHLDKQQKAESNKENIQIPLTQAQPQPRNPSKPRIVDRQAGAERISFDDNSGSQNDDDGSESHFEQMRNPPIRSDRRSSRPPHQHASPQSTDSQGPSNKKARMRNNGASNQPDVVSATQNGELTASQTHQIANTAGKKRKVIVDMNNPKPTQKRTPWSEDETQQLLELIEKHGTSWSVLMDIDRQSGSLLQDRDDVKLKDKARNMKMDFLKAGRRLPKNFDRIALSKLLIAKLKALQIDYDEITGMRVDAIVNYDDGKAPEASFSDFD
ncbi:hypothetical protein ACLMJK_008979 [Lecanora helva]